jgi:hypothetical protein
MNAPRCFVAVACLNHVRRGASESFAQVCHGKSGPLGRMRVGDRLVYYSPAEEMGGGAPCRSFSAIGTVEGEAFQVDMGGGFRPYRRRVSFDARAHLAPIVPLLDRLSFIQDKRRWGYPFRRGLFEVTEADFRVIAEAMEASS